LQIGKQFVVSTHVDQYLNNQRTELLLDLLANPADKDALHTQNLQQLVNEYPQSGLLHALLSYAGENENLQQVSVYYDPKILYKLNKDIDALHIVSEDQLLLTNNQEHITGYFHTDELLLAPWDNEADTVTEGDGQAETLPPLVPDAGYEAAQHPVTGTFNEDVNAPAATPIDEPVFDEIAETSHEHIAPVATEIDQLGEEPVSAATAPIEPVAEAPVEQPIEEDVFDEIVSIDDINLAVQEYYSTVMESQTDLDKPAQFDDIYAEALKSEEASPSPVAEAPAEPAEAQKEETVFKDRKVDLTDEAEKLILNNIAATDFFVFEEALGDKKKTEEVKEEAPQPESVEVASPTETTTIAEPVAVEHPIEPVVEAKAEPAINPYEKISKYHDEKMPYSFMWWLDKTRKEHSGIYQPFVQFKPDSSQPIKPAVPDELQHQYIESIFQLNTVEDLEKGVEEKPVFDTKKKEDEIIERFIHEVPQIRPQSADKLDNENKAKRSSEDEDELVTETLAQIYIDQMLYPKAIDTYKKLMLKFPEKSRYFAGQIEQLQKK
jgi:hypothetical protein